MRVNRSAISIFEKGSRTLSMAGDSASGIFSAVKEVFRDYMDFDQKTSFLGVYVLSHYQKILALGPFVGDATVHDLIPVGRGFVGQCAARATVLNAYNVRDHQNYLPCRPDVLSELVIPIKNPENNQVVAVLDADSRKAHAYNESDVELLSELADMILYQSIILSNRLRIHSDFTK